jgi:DNA-binding FadR family transcriptional regulator
MAEPVAGITGPLDGPAGPPSRPARAVASLPADGSPPARAVASLPADGSPPARAVAARPADEPTAFRLVEPQRYERIAERLAADIRAGRLAPGQRLPSERELARRLAVGRASVREAIAALALRGVLETRPGSGSFVAADALERLAPGSELTAHDAGPFDLLEARLLLEPGVAALAARRGRRDEEAERLLDAMDAAAEDGDRGGWNDGDRRFHRQLAALTSNPVLLGLADEIAALMDQPLWHSTPRSTSSGCDAT